MLRARGGRLYDPGFCDHFTGMEEACQHSTVDCSIRGLWMRVQRAVDGVLSTTSLQDLLAGVEGSPSTGEEELLQVNPSG